MQHDQPALERLREQILIYLNDSQDMRTQSSPRIYAGQFLLTLDQEQRLNLPDCYDLHVGIAFILGQSKDTNSLILYDTQFFSALEIPPSMTELEMSLDEIGISLSPTPTLLYVSDHKRIQIPKEFLDSVSVEGEVMLLGHLTGLSIVSPSEFDRIEKESLKSDEDINKILRDLEF